MLEFVIDILKDHCSPPRHKTSGSATTKGAVALGRSSISSGPAAAGTAHLPKCADFGTLAALPGLGTELASIQIVHGVPPKMALIGQVLAVLDEVLSLNGRSGTFGSETYLRGAVPELDSMAIVAVLAALEDRFSFVIHDDEISGETFSTVGTLTRFVERKLGA